MKATDTSEKHQYSLILFPLIELNPIILEWPKIPIWALGTSTQSSIKESQWKDTHSWPVDYNTVLGASFQGRQVLTTLLPIRFV